MKKKVREKKLQQSRAELDSGKV